jgi:hypothetical protein
MEKVAQTEDSEMDQLEALETIAEELTELMNVWGDTDPVDRKLKLDEISTALIEAIKME